MPKRRGGPIVDPYNSFRFRVEYQNIILGRFSEVSGLQAETEVEEFREGGVNDFVHKFAKFTKYQNLVLKRGITENDDLWNWYKDVISGNFKNDTINNIAVVLIDFAGHDTGTWRWEFSDAYPVKWSGSDLNSTTNNVFIESVEFTHHGMTAIKGT